MDGMGWPPLHSLFNSCPRGVLGSGQPLSMLALPLEMKAFSHCSENRLLAPTSPSTLPTLLLLGEAIGKRPAYAAAALERLVCFGLLWFVGGLGLERFGEGSGMEVLSPAISTHVLGCQEAHQVKLQDLRHT